MSEVESTATPDSLVDELDELTAAASRLQDDDIDIGQISSVRDRYYDWYARALAVVPTSREAQFRDAFEGGQFTNRIRAFLSNPKAPNPLYDASSPENPITGSRYRYDFESTFRSSADIHRQILIEVRHRSKEAGRPLPPDGDVFIVHGHNEAALHTVARTVQGLTGRTPVILREQPSQGRTIIEKIEAHAARCSFAIALLTHDDQGRAVNGPADLPRARQNVVFEAGYFVGLLGRQRVVLLHEPGVELPSDLNGIVYVSLASSWQLEIGKELRAAGVAVDFNGL